MKLKKKIPNKLCINFARTDLEETKKINHHGHVREVSTNEDGKGGGNENKNMDDNALKTLQINDYFDFAFQTGLDEDDGKPKPKIAFIDPDDDSTKTEREREKKVNLMNACIFFSRKIKPVIILIFVLFYWGSGLIRANQIQ